MQAKWFQLGRVHMGDRVVMAPVPLKYRTFWPRFWAGIIDALVFVPLGFLSNWIWETHPAAPFGLTWFAFTTAIGLGYGIVLHGLFGQTLGKRICAVRVVDVSERPLTMLQATLRDAPIVAFTLWDSIEAVELILATGQPVSQEISDGDRLSTFFYAVWFALELLTMLSNPKRRSLHDFLARSVVIRTRA